MSSATRAIPAEGRFSRSFSISSIVFGLQGTRFAPERKQSWSLYSNLIPEGRSTNLLNCALLLIGLGR